jgi:hypothetical protein
MKHSGNLRVLLMIGGALAVLWMLHPHAAFSIGR